MRKSILSQAARHDTRPKCHACGYVFEATMHAGAGKAADVTPQVGAVCICVKCGEFGQFDDGLVVVPFSLDDIVPEDREKLLTVQRQVRSRWQEPS